MEIHQPKRRPTHMPPITRELVFEVANQIKAEKKRVTNHSVRAALQGGSLNTIAPLVREWHQTENESLCQPPNDPPDGVEESILLASKAICKIAKELAIKHIQELNKRIEEMETEHQLIASQYEEKLQSLKVQLDVLAEERDQIKATLSDRDRELAVVNVRLLETIRMLALTTLHDQDQPT